MCVCDNRDHAFCAAQLRRLDAQRRALPRPPVEGALFEQQLRNYCGMHAVNNLFGAQILTPFLVRAAMIRANAMVRAQRCARGCVA